VAVGWGYCAPQKVLDSEVVTCPAGSVRTYCAAHWDAGFWGSPYDDGDGTDHIYNSKGDIDAQNYGSDGCYVHVRAFNCDATTVRAEITCVGI
jgi:hypothetical protein